MLLGYQKTQKLQRWCWINFAFWSAWVSSCAVFSSLGLDAPAEAVEGVTSVVAHQSPILKRMRVSANPLPHLTGRTLPQTPHATLGAAAIAYGTSLPEGSAAPTTNTSTPLTFRAMGSDVPFLQHQTPLVGKSSNGDGVTRKSSELSVLRAELASKTDNSAFPSLAAFSVAIPSHSGLPFLLKQTDRETADGNPLIVERYPIQFARGSAADLLRSTDENVAQTDGVQPEQPLESSPQGNSDPDLGTLRLQEPELPPQKPSPAKPEPVLHLLPRIGFYQTNNVFSGVDPVDDNLIFGSLTLWTAPKLGPGTYLTASVEGNLIRYLDRSEFNYNLLRLRAGIRQRITPQMYGEIGWNNQQFFRAEQGDRFLNDQTVYLLLSRRDLLTPRLVLDSYYDFRANFSDPGDRSRITNSLYLSLSYYLQRNLQVGLDYQFSRSDFTRRDRQDQYHRVGGRVTYGVLGDSGEISVQGGLTVGDSSESSIDFDGYFLSITYSIDLPIF